MARGLNFRFRKKRDCTIYVAKTKTLISFAVTAKLICVFVFAYAKWWFSHEAAHFSVVCRTKNVSNLVSENSLDSDLFIDSIESKSSKHIIKHGM